MVYKSPAEILIHRGQMLTKELSVSNLIQFFRAPLDYITRDLLSENEFAKIPVKINDYFKEKGNDNKESFIDRIRKDYSKQRNLIIGSGEATEKLLGSLACGSCNSLSLDQKIMKIKEYMDDGYNNGTTLFWVICGIVDPALCRSQQKLPTEENKKFS